MIPHFLDLGHSDIGHQTLDFLIAFAEVALLGSPCSVDVFFNLCIQKPRKIAETPYSDRKREIESTANNSFKFLRDKPHLKYLNEEIYCLKSIKHARKHVTNKILDETTNCQVSK